MCKNCSNKCAQTTCTACKYNGPSIPELNIQTGMSYDTAMSYIFEYVSSIQAQDGQTGAPGPAGANGNDGVGIDSVTDNGDGTYTFNFTDGSDFTTSDLTGPVGPTAGPIFYVSDGQLSGNRVVDQNGNTITFNNNSVFVVSSSIAPSGGNGSFTLDGYGTLSTDLVEKISSDAGVIRESYGDKSQTFYGQLVMGSAFGSSAWIEVDGASFGRRGIAVSSNGLIAINGTDNTNIGIFGGSLSGIGILGQADTGQGGRFISNGLSSYHRGSVLIETGITEAYNPGSLLSVNSTTKYSLPHPRMTEADRLLLSGLTPGAVVYQTDGTEGYYIYKSTGWAFII